MFSLHQMAVNVSKKRNIKAESLQTRNLTQPLINTAVESNTTVFVVNLIEETCRFVSSLL